jgi:anti-anti-sigma factor
MMANVSSIDSTGTAELISAYNRIIHAGGDLVLVAPPQDVKGLFLNIGLDKLVQFSDTVEDALKKLKKEV